MLWFGLQHNINKLTVQNAQVLTSAISVISLACNLSVVIESQLTMADHIATVCHSAYYHL